jgi:co-chaperonin GroES (HSP10)
MENNIFEPIDNHVIVKLIEEEIDEGQLIVHKDADEMTLKCKVIQVGQGVPVFDYTSDKLVNGGKVAVKRYEMFLREDDIVLIHSFTGKRFQHNDEEYFIIKENEILTKINE